MSDDNKFQKSDAATGNVRRPTVVSWNGGRISVKFQYDVADTEALDLQSLRRGFNFHRGKAA